MANNEWQRDLINKMREYNFSLRSCQGWQNHSGMCREFYSPQCLSGSVPTHVFTYTHTHTHSPTTHHLLCLFNKVNICNRFLWPGGQRVPLSVAGRRDPTGRPLRERGVRLDKQERHCQVHWGPFGADARANSSTTTSTATFQCYSETQVLTDVSS